MHAGLANDQNKNAKLALPPTDIVYQCYNHTEQQLTPLVRLTAIAAA